MPLHIPRELAARWAVFLRPRLGPILCLLFLVALLIAALAARLSIALERVAG